MLTARLFWRRDKVLNWGTVQSTDQPQQAFDDPGRLPERHAEQAGAPPIQG